MPLSQKFYFFRCYHCGAWYYTNKIIKSKKCIKCNRSFTFQKSTKFSKVCTQSEAISIIKELKIKSHNENLTKYISRKTDHLTIFSLKDKNS